MSDQETVLFSPSKRLRQISVKFTTLLAGIYVNLKEVVMFSRGPILMIFAAMLIGSPIVAQMFEGDRHVGINLVGASKDACSNSGVDTIAGRLGCSNQKNTRNRKYMANGALFVRP